LSTAVPPKGIDPQGRLFAVYVRCPSSKGEGRKDMGKHQFAQVGIVVLVILTVLAIAGLASRAAGPPEIEWDGATPRDSLPARTVEAAGPPVEAAPHSILSDVQVRRAIAYCTDKDAIVAAVYPTLTPAERQDLIVDTFIHPDSWAYTAPTTTTQPPATASWTPLAGRCPPARPIA
jgi:hypothetical protein